MMVLDFSQIATANLMVALGKHQNIDITLEAFRAKILENFATLVGRNKQQYGKVIIAIDGQGSWRREIYPYYKAHRSKNRKASPINWTLVYQHYAQIIKELKESFGYIVIEVPRAEGDDVIASVVDWYFENRLMEDILILSGDKDFKQLHYNDRIRQWSPVLKKWVGVADRERELLEHVVGGDSDDGVPNILSPDDVYVDKSIRSAKMTAGRLEFYTTNPVTEFDSVAQRNYARNQKMIDLRYIPTDVRAAIVESLEEQLANPTKSDVFNYLFKHQLRSLQPLAGKF